MTTVATPSPSTPVASMDNSNLSATTRENRGDVNDWYDQFQSVGEGNEDLVWKLFQEPLQEYILHPEALPMPRLKDAKYYKLNNIFQNVNINSVTPVQSESGASESSFSSAPVTPQQNKGGDFNRLKMVPLGALAKLCRKVKSDYNRRRRQTSEIAEFNCKQRFRCVWDEEREQVRKQIIIELMGYRAMITPAITNGDVGLVSAKNWPLATKQSASRPRSIYMIHIAFYTRRCSIKMQINDSIRSVNYDWLPVGFCLYKYSRAIHSGRLGDPQTVLHRNAFNGDFISREETLKRYGKNAAQIETKKADIIESNDIIEVRRLKNGAKLEIHTNAQSLPATPDSKKASKTPVESEREQSTQPESVDNKIPLSKNRGSPTYKKASVKNAANAANVKSDETDQTQQENERSKEALKKKIDDRVEPLIKSSGVKNQMKPTDSSSSMSSKSEDDTKGVTSVPKGVDAGKQQRGSTKCKCKKITCAICSPPSAPPTPTTTPSTPKKDKKQREKTPSQQLKKMKAASPKAKKAI